MPQGGLVCRVLPIAVPRSLSTWQSSWLAFPLVDFVPLDFSFGFLGLLFKLNHLLATLTTGLPLLLLWHASRRTCVSAPTTTTLILIEAVRGIARALRGLAASLDQAADRAEGRPASGTPAISSDTVDTVDWDLITHLDSLSGHPVRDLPGPSVPSTSGYNEVSNSFPALPEHCLDLCRRLSGTPEEVRSRATRAWVAGCWARATIEGRVQKPRPSPKLGLQATVYIILKAPSISRPVRVSSAADYFKLLPKFDDSVSHSFPSLSEGQVYCLAAGYSFPEPADRQ